MIFLNVPLLRMGDEHPKSVLSHLKINNTMSLVKSSFDVRNTKIVQLSRFSCPVIPGVIKNLINLPTSLIMPLCVLLFTALTFLSLRSHPTLQIRIA